jgi:hypothetical protein
VPQTTQSPKSELYATFRVSIPIVDHLKKHGGKVETNVKKARRALEDRLAIKRSWRIQDGVTLEVLKETRNADEEEGNKGEGQAEVQ